MRCGFIFNSSAPITTHTHTHTRTSTRTHTCVPYPHPVSAEDKGQQAPFHLPPVVLILSPIRQTPFTIVLPGCIWPISFKCFSYTCIYCTIVYKLCVHCVTTRLRVDWTAVRILVGGDFLISNTSTPTHPPFQSVTKFFPGVKARGV